MNSVASLRSCLSVSSSASFLRISPAHAAQEADRQVAHRYHHAGQLKGVARPGGGAEFLGIPLCAAAHRRSPLARTRSREALDRRPQRDHIRRSLRAARPRRLEPPRRRNRQGRLPLPQRDRSRVARHQAASRHVLDSRRRQRRRHRIQRALQRRYARQSRRHSRHRQLPSRHLRISRPSRTHRRIRPPRLRQLRPHGPDPRAPLGPRQHRQLRWRRQQHHRLRPVRRRHGHQHAHDLASRERPLPESPRRKRSGLHRARCFRLPQAEQAGADLAKSLNAPAGDGQIKYLRTLSASEMLAALGQAPAAIAPASVPTSTATCLPTSPPSVFATGQEAHIPFVYGTTTREFGGNQSADQLRARHQPSQPAPSRPGPCRIWPRQRRTGHDRSKVRNRRRSVVRRHDLPLPVRHAGRVARARTTQPGSTNSTTPFPARKHKARSTPPTFPTSSATSPRPATSPATSLTSTRNSPISWRPTGPTSRKPATPMVPAFRTGPSKTTPAPTSSSSRMERSRTATGLRTAQCDIYREWLTARST